MRGNTPTPEVTVCGKRYNFNVYFPEGVNVSVGGECSPLTPDLVTTTAKARKHESHQTKIANFSQDSGAAFILKYADGSMRPFFQCVVPDKGAEVLKKRTSIANAPVSCTKEALLAPQEIPAAAGSRKLALRQKCRTRQ